MTRYRPYVSQLSRFVFDLAVKLNILKQWGPSNDMESGVVNTRAEAERRRALALKALDQRLATKPSPATRSSGSLPSLNTSVGPSGSSNPPSAKPDKGDVVFDAGTDETTSSGATKE